MIITTSPGVEGHRILIVFADAGILVWGAMAALAPGHLLGPADALILAAGYEASPSSRGQGL